MWHPTYFTFHMSPSGVPWFPYKMFHIMPLCSCIPLFTLNSCTPYSPSSLGHCSRFPYSASLLSPQLLFLMLSAVLLVYSVLLVHFVQQIAHDVEDNGHWFLVLVLVPLLQCCFFVGGGLLGRFSYFIINQPLGWSQIWPYLQTMASPCFVRFWKMPGVNIRSQAWPWRVVVISINLVHVGFVGKPSAAW